MQDQTALLEALQNAGLSAQAQVPLAPYTTFRIGGPAAVFCTPASETELIAKRKVSVSTCWDVAPTLFLRMKALTVW